MQKQRLKASVFPAGCGKNSFGTDWENTVSVFRQGSLLHCAERSAGADLSLPNDNESRNQTFPYTKGVFRIPFCVPKDKSKPLAIRFWRTAGFEPAKHERVRLAAQAFFWHTLWNILVHRRERLM